MSHLVLIRHSLPEIRQGVAASQWHLSAEGRQRAHHLAMHLRDFNIPIIYSSLEPKAIETAEILAADLGISCQTAPGLHEHVRPARGSFSQAVFENEISAFFSKRGELVMGSETAAQAEKRFSNAVREIVARYPTENLAISSHGTVISLFVGKVCNIDPFPFWKMLGLPAIVILERNLLDGEQGFQLSKLVNHVMVNQ